LDFRESSIANLCELAIDNPSAKASIRIGAKLRLLGAGSKGSLTKRRFAVDRILADRAIVARLHSYFEPAEAAQLEPMIFPGPTADDLQFYSSGVWRLNQSQCQAFTRILTSGPISLLQGPPGTGKTTFIAALLHYLVTRERARRILLVSQTHEAVNNALEKASELFLQTGTAFDAVRLGMQSVVSEPIRSLTTDSVEQSYRESFKAEQQSRLMKLGIELGLPSEFCKEFITLQIRLRTIANRIERFHSLQGTSDADGQHRVARVTALRETFFDIASDVYDIRGDESPLVVLERIEDRLIATHGVLSPDATDRLRMLVSLSAEWISALGSPDANFVEFLARSRTIVAGTCVGIGQRGAGVAQNIYDWVIIDEAGRAAPSELAVSMQTGRRILLVGDHKQLPPTFSEDVREAMRQKFGPDADDTVLGSDFARIFDSDYGRKVGATLVAQYRMVSGIGNLVSNCFYDGLLETARGPSPEYYEFLPSALSREVTWIDTADLRERSFEQRSNEGGSASNDAEARVVRRIVESEDFVAFLADDLTSQNKAHEVPIGVICFYDRQREVIDRMLAEATWLGDLRRWVKVDTVDGYQGKENRIVVLSTVRNNPHGRPGFLRNPNRINVAISRAMERLVIVGSRTMWNQRNRDLPLGRVLAHIEAQMETGSSGIEASEQFLE
jgi:DNA polymerase III delta prime subunit